MSEQKQTLKLDEKLKAEDQMFSLMLRREGDNKILLTAIGLAVLVHICVMFVRFPEIKKAVSAKEKKVIVKEEEKPKTKRKR